MYITVKLDAGPAEARTVEYRWNVDTDILTAAMSGAAGGAGMMGSVEIEGTDGTWLNLDELHHLVGDRMLNVPPFPSDS